MKAKIILTSLIATIVLIGCESPKTAYPDISEAEVQNEKRIQQDLAAKEELKKQENKEIKRLQQQQMLLRVGQRLRKGGVELCKQLDRPINDCVYKFELTKGGKSVNAYADGKKIYVTPAMMRFVKSDEELAVVLGHEYAHNVMEHSKSKQINALVGGAIGFALEALASYNGVGTGGELTNIGQNVGALSYSQNYEREADYVGLYITTLSGYSIRSAPYFWRRISTKHNNSIIEATTHPTTPERFIALQKAIKEISDKKKSGQRIFPNFNK